MHFFLRSLWISNSIDSRTPMSSPWSSSLAAAQQVLVWFCRTLWSLLTDNTPTASSQAFSLLSSGPSLPQADSGGPLSCHIDGVWVLMGVVSWGLECGKSPLGVYINVTYYQKWIKAIISRARGSGGDCTYVISCSLLYFFFWLSWDLPEPWP